MTALSAAVGTRPLVHGVHIGFVLLGLWGLAALLLPHALRARHPPSGAARSTAPRDEHEARVLRLRATVATGALGRPGTAAAGPGSEPQPQPQPRSGTQPSRPHVPPVRPIPTPTVQDHLLPVVAVATGAAGAIHAAVVPPHLAESLLFGAFFIASAVVQAGWAAAVLRHPTRRLLQLGALGNLSCVTLWLVTRTVGLPGGLLPAPEAVGPWDVACAAWELLAVGCCLALLRAGRSAAADQHSQPAPSARPGLPGRGPAYDAWSPAARAVLGLAVVTLAFLVLMGGHS